MSDAREAALLVYMRQSESYFWERAKKEPLFLPEARATAEIVALLESDESSDYALSSAVSIVNRTALEEHYNGSAWRDLKAQLLAACSSAGVVAQLRKTEGSGLNS